MLEHIHDLGFSLLVQDFPGGIYPYDGSWAAWMGGDNYEFALLQQQVVVPSSLPYLYYWLWINSVDVCGADFGYIYVNGDLVETYDLCFTTGGWAQNMIDLRAYAGTQVLFQIAVQCDGQWASSLFLDHFAFHPVLTRSVPIVMETSEMLTESLKRDVLDR